MALPPAPPPLRAPSRQREGGGVQGGEVFLKTENETYLKNLVVKNCALDTEWVPPVHTDIHPEPVRKDYIPYVEDVIAKLS